MKKSIAKLLVLVTLSFSLLLTGAVSATVGAQDNEISTFRSDKDSNDDYIN